MVTRFDANPPDLNRRTLLALGLGGGLAGAAGIGAVHQAVARPKFSGPPFSVGVASGEPSADSVVLWTKIAPDPYADDGLGGVESPAAVEWQLAADEKLTKIIRQGTATATADDGYTLHLLIDGLQPGREYFYRFRVGDEVSPTGRTKTLKDGRPERMRFGFASCQSYSQGWFTGYRHLVADDPDVVFFLGDYIYRRPGKLKAGVDGHLAERTLQPLRRCERLNDFRIRYNHYHRDAGLAEAHRLLPWVATIDDNEIDDNWWGGDDDPARVARRTAGMQAFWENLPLSPASRPQGWRLPGAYRRLRYGDLVDFHVITTRHFRSGPVKNDCAEDAKDGGYCPAPRNPDRTILGRDQERWLHDGLAGSTARWNVIANQIFFTQFDRDSDPDPDARTFNLDGWDGYVADRQQLLDHLARNKINNTVIISGDSHRNWVFETPPRFDEWDASSRPAATEFMVTSITSGGERPQRPEWDPNPAKSPQLRYNDTSHGYALATVGRDTMRVDYRAVSTVAAPTAEIKTISSWEVSANRPGARDVRR